MLVGPPAEVLITKASHPLAAVSDGHPLSVLDIVKGRIKGKTRKLKELSELKPQILDHFSPSIWRKESEKTLREEGAKVTLSSHT